MKTSNEYLSSIRQDFKMFCRTDTTNISLLEEFLADYPRMSYRAWQVFGLAEDTFEEQVILDRLKIILLYNPHTRDCEQGALFDSMCYDPAYVRSIAIATGGRTKKIMDYLDLIKCGRWDLLLSKLLSAKRRAMRRIAEQQDMTTPFSDMPEGFEPPGMEEIDVDSLLASVDAERAYEAHRARFAGHGKAEVVEALAFASKTLRKDPFELAGDKRFLSFLEKQEGQKMLSQLKRCYIRKK